jgi:hypothetical protein
MGGKSLLQRYESSGDADQLLLLEEAVNVVDRGRYSRWTEEFGDSREFLHLLLAKNLASWIRSNPPEAAGYEPSDPRNPLYEYFDGLLSVLRNEVVREIVFSPLMAGVSRRVLRSLKSSGKTSEKKLVADRYPEYPELLRTIREAKRRWNEEDASIKQTPAFRMMGGLARLGSHWGSAYRRHVERAQEMEKSVLGKTLTKLSRPR